MIDEKKLMQDLMEAEKEHENCMIMPSFSTALNIIRQQPKVMEWIPVSEGLPKEHESIFAKLKGTDKWIPCMFETYSEEVIVTIEFEDGTRYTKVAKTLDGKWQKDISLMPHRVVAWQKQPEPYKGE